MGKNKMNSKRLKEKNIIKRVLSNLKMLSSK